MDSRTLDTKKTTTSPAVSSGTGDRIILDIQTLCAYELIRDERPFLTKLNMYNIYLIPIEIACYYSMPIKDHSVLRITLGLNSLRYLLRNMATETTSWTLLYALSL